MSNEEYILSELIGLSVINPTSIWKDFLKRKLSELYEVKKMVSDCRTIYCHDEATKFYNRKFEARDAEFDMLERNGIAVNLWLHRNVQDLYYDPDFMTFCLRKGMLQLAKLFHLQNLLKQLDEHLGLGNQGFWDMYCVLVVHTSHERLLDISYMNHFDSFKQQECEFQPLRAIDLILPEGFIFWSLEDFIKDFHHIINDNISATSWSNPVLREKYFPRAPPVHQYPTDEFFHISRAYRHERAVRTLVSTISFGPDLLNVAKQVSNLYFFPRFNEAKQKYSMFYPPDFDPYLFPDVMNIRYFGDVEDILELFMAVVANYCFQKYKEELMVKTWKPSRVVDWCFDEEEKADFI